MNARKIATTLKGKWHGSYGIARCPVHDDRNPSLSISDGQDGKLLVHCHAGCEGRDVLDALKAHGLLDDQFDLSQRLDNFQRPPNQKALDDLTDRADAEGRMKVARSIWQASRCAQKTSVETYLQSRGITSPAPLSIRYHPALKHNPTGLHFEAMVSAVQALNRTITGIHRTYLLPGGKGKARVSQAKMMLGLCAGGAVRLAGAGPELVLSEGIETGLSVLQTTGKPVWACLSTSGLKAVALPPEVETIIIAADGDEQGITAAEEAASRFVREGRTAKIAKPPMGMDWNDVLVKPADVIPFPGYKEAVNG